MVDCQREVSRRAEEPLASTPTTDALTVCNGSLRVAKLQIILDSAKSECLFCDLRASFCQKQALETRLAKKKSAAFGR